jgi:hypothetical protein
MLFLGRKRQKKNEVIDKWLHLWALYWGVLTLQRRGIGANRQKNMWKYWHYEQNAGPSTAPLAMRLREAPFRMTISISINHLLKLNVDTP